MPDSSSTSSSSSLPHDLEISEQPTRFTLFLAHEDFERIFMTAQRHASVPVGEYVCTVEFGSLHHMWFFREQNITSWFETATNDDEPTTGSLNIPAYFLEAIHNIVTHEEEQDVELHINRDENTITYSAKQSHFTATLPAQPECSLQSQHVRSSRLHVNTDHFAQVGPFLSAVPIDIPEDEDGHPSVFQPFITFTYDGTDLIVSRDWSSLGGPVLTLRLQAGGDYRGSFSMFAPAVAREFFLADSYGSGALVFEFSDEEPHVCKLTNTTWGIDIQLAKEYVFRYRRRLEAALAVGDNELNVKRDSRIGWDPVVVVEAGDRTITATITEASNGSTHYVRLKTDIISDTPWTPELATEINAWNDQWPTVKLLHADNVVHVVADVPMAALPDIAGTVVDLVAKAQIVDELIGAVL